MTDGQIRKQLIKDITDFIFAKYKISTKKQLVDTLLTEINVDCISKRQLDRFFIENKISAFQKKTANCLSNVLGFKNYDLYKTSLELGVEGVLIKVPKSLVVLPELFSKDIIGREQERNDLKKILDTNEKVVLVNGIGGIGKTTLAKNYLTEFKKHYHHLAWIEVNTSVKEAFISRIDLIDSLGIEKQIHRLKEEDQFVDKAFNLIINRMRSLKTTHECPNNLLILDNVSEDIEHLDVLDFISLRPYWKVLVTSREHLDGFFHYEIDTLSPDFAKDLFYHHYKKEKNDDLLEQLLKYIDYHTLGIEIIAKTVQSLRLSIREILNIIKKKGLDISDQANINLKHNKNKRLQHIKKYLNAVFDIAGLTEYQLWIMTQFIVLPSKYVPYEVPIGNGLIHLLDLQDIEKNRFTRELNGIVKSGWLQWDMKNDAFKLHKLIQEVLEVRLNPNIYTCESLIQSLSGRLEYQNLDYEAFLYADRIDHVIKGDLNLNYADFLDKLSCVSMRVERHRPAIGYQKKALNVRLNKGASQDKISESFNGLALAFYNLGNYKEALKYQLRDKDIMLSNGFNESYELAITYNNLSLIYRKLPENFNDAYVFQKKAMKIAKKIKDQDLNCVVYNNMGNLLFLEGKYERSIPYFKESLMHRKKHSDSLSIAEGKMNLGVAILETKDFHNAKDLLGESLETYEKYELLFDQCRIQIHLARFFHRLNKEKYKSNINQHLKSFDKILARIDKRTINTKELKKLLNWRNDLDDQM